MTRTWCAPLLLGLALLGFGAQGAEPNKMYWLTPEERLWIAEHPVLRVAVMTDLYAIEYMHDGKLHGLPAEYFNEISAKLGVSFNFVPAEDLATRVAMLQQGKVDLISVIWNLGPEFSIPGLLNTIPYLISATIVIGRNKTPYVFDLSRLEGKTVVVSAEGPYGSLLRAKGYNVKIVKSGSPTEALTLVAEGNADVVLGTESYLMPYFGPQFEGRLQLSGAIASLVSEFHMAVRDDQVLLHSILQKTFATISDGPSLALTERWHKETGYGPSVGSKSIIEGHQHEVMLLGLLLVLLLGLVHQTYRQSRRAVRSEAEKAKFLAVMSHEIRSPMNAVLAAVELLSLTKLDHEQRHLSSLASNGANTLLSLLDDVLEMSRLEAHQLRLELESVDIAALAGQAIALYSLRAQAKKIDLTLETQGPITHLMLDEARVRQILHNLVSNAIKFTEVGSVHVAVMISDTHELNIKQLDISVTDTGIGVPVGAQEKLFVPYSQASNSYKRSGGSGLGLVICRELVELMGGTIALSSVVGEGTVVTSSLRAEVSAAPDKVEGAGQISEQVVPAIVEHTLGPEVGVNLHILVVEDTLANQQVLLAQLRNFGFVAALAPDAAHAVREFKERAFDLVLLDCDLPDESGYLVATQMRAHEATTGRQRCPIIAISASTGHEHSDQCFAVDMDGTLSKPIQLARLKTTIELWCDVALVPKQSVPQEPFGLAQVRHSVLSDLLSLLEAAALGDMPSALHRAHRLHGGGLALGWVAFALNAQKIEQLLHANTPQDDPSYRTQLREIMQQWRQLDQELSAFEYE
ncbi:ATP-binding protein [Pseudomonas proteolytica]|uniref:ATP-binding protein n=1 Tax=Pseudomonas proteolytica TaxID=219574 RepID=UPI0023DF73F6|nr:ATP-binding protein [Pseudomonas proteolytica]MDF3164520.1 ATP-binding protein [Pseudomonas proteolytica]